MKDYLERYRKTILKQRIFTIVYFAFTVLIFVGGLTGIIVCDFLGVESLLSFFVMLTLVGPVVLVMVYLLFLQCLMGKRRNRLDKELENSSLSADEIMEMGKKLNISLFNVAVMKRAKELGIEHIPEGCIRDGILPTADDLLGTGSGDH